MSQPPTSRAGAATLDARDPLASARSAFVLPEGLIYLDGHSLGPATHTALDRVGQAAGREWAQGLIRSWNDAGWIDLAARTGARIARLIGARPGEVIVCDSVSVNLFKLAAAALPLVRSRTLLIEEDEFPTDQYIAEGLASLSGAPLMSLAPGDGATALAREGGVLIKSVVNYRTALMADMAAHEAAAAQGGGIVLWDLSHATGVLDVDMGSSDARLAAGCTYKYLNGGPGSPAFVYARRDVSATMRSPLPGWMGHAAPFAFDAGYRPADHVARFASGTPAILSLAALSGALYALEDVDMSLATRKARALGDLCLARASAMKLATSSPAEREMRGGHVSLLHEDGYAVVQALAARGVIADFRAPDTIRFGFSPLFIRYVDVWDAMDILGEILATRAFDTPDFRRQATVT
ncbi:MAG: aminotransferase class V-fold PLP-dependent enzyme [Alphaproteobacteria bacterium]|nr:aminotransferase class V-fold PLP-dependent enzyme [Alphaproteobacteria bacterium]